MSEPLRELATTRLASLCLNRRGRHRGFTYDDYLVRGGSSSTSPSAAPSRTPPTRWELDHARAADTRRSDTGLDQRTLRLGRRSAVLMLEDLGDARWAGELVVERLAELRIRMRAIGRAAG